MSLFMSGIQAVQSVKPQLHNIAVQYITMLIWSYSLVCQSIVPISELTQIHLLFRTKQPIACVSNAHQRHVQYAHLCEVTCSNETILYDKSVYILAHIIQQICIPVYVSIYQIIPIIQQICIYVSIYQIIHIIQQICIYVSSRKVSKVNPLYTHQGTQNYPGMAIRSKKDKEGFSCGSWNTHNHTHQFCHCK